MSVRLFDVSHWNDPAVDDFPAAHAAGFAGGYVKATDWWHGKPTTDSSIRARIPKMRAAGLHQGAYLFFHPDVDVAAQVGHFHDVVGPLGCDLVPVLDHEAAPAGMSSTVIAARALAGCHALQTAFGVAPMVYTDRAFITEGKCAGLEQFPLWIADYSLGVTHPDLRGRKTYALWQTGQAHVPGLAAGDGDGTDVNVAPDLVPLLAHPPRPAPVPPVSSPLLHKGDVGPKVTDVQHALDLCDPRNLTAHTDGMGKFGQRTQTVLTTFQRHRHLKVTATTTPETWAALRAVAHHHAR